MVSTPSDVAIVGAGPYGLSIAAHLRAAGINFRIFGKPMQVWLEHMPEGMLLKSDGFASNLSDPEACFTLKRFCEMSGIPYDDMTIPVRLETFRAYGLAFQQRLVPELQLAHVRRIDLDNGVYRLTLDDGTVAAARRVVIAVGISQFAYTPPALREFPEDLASHSFAHRDVERFRGQEVTVVGSGASAVDLAVLLKDCGAEPILIARRDTLRFNDPPPLAPRTFWAAMRYPSSPIGPGWAARFYSDAPGLFHRLPESLRLWAMSRQYPSAAGWPMKARFAGRVRTILGYRIQRARVEDGQLRLVLSGKERTCELSTSHVIAATGYRVDLRRLAFLSPELLQAIRMVKHAPVLSSTFASSVPGLYFVGVASANSFGPLMRFACGADWTSKRITAALARSALKGPVPTAVAGETLAAL